REAGADLQRLARDERARIDALRILDVEPRIAAEEMHPFADAAGHLELEALGLDVDAAIERQTRIRIEAGVLRIVVLLGAENRQRGEQLTVEELALQSELVAHADSRPERREILAELGLRLVDIAVARIDAKRVGKCV